MAGNVCTGMRAPLIDYEIDPTSWLTSFPCQITSCGGTVGLEEEIDRLFFVNDVFPEVGIDMKMWRCGKCRMRYLPVELLVQIREYWGELQQEELQEQ